MSGQAAPQHQHFWDYRGVVQLRLRTAGDLDALHTLDPARWSSTSVPVAGLLVDRALLSFLDTDGDGRIRVHDMLAAHRFTTSLLRNTARLADASDTVRVADLSESPEAVRLKTLVSARLSSPSEVGLAQIRAFADAYKKKLPNGDGVVTAAQLGDAPENAGAGALIKAILDFGAGADDLSGERGAGAAGVDAFMAHKSALEAWHKEQSYDADVSKAVDAILAAEARIDRWFLLCDLVAAEENAAQRLTASVEALQSLDVADAAAIRAWVEKAPLARPEADGVLDVEKPLNQLYAEEIRALFADALPRVLGMKPGIKALTRLGRAEWRSVKEKIAPIVEHKKKKPKDIDAAAASDDAVVARLRALIAEDERASAELLGLQDLERLALYQRWLLPLANNMVSFPGLFFVGERCMFEAGTLVLDGRDLTFCVNVENRAAHRSVAEKSNLFVVYCELSRKEGDVVKKAEIAAAVTSGTRRGIAIGKRGVFYDRDNKEHDAVVVDVIERPISLYEAAIAPFVRLRDLIADRIEKVSQSSLGALEKRAGSHAVAATDTVVAAAPSVPPMPSSSTAPAATPAAVPVPTAVAPPAPAPPRPAPAPPQQPQPQPQQGSPSGLQALLVGGGIAIAAVGSALAFALQTIASIAPLKIVVAIGALALGIMALSAFLGWLKLRRRDLSTMLEACGWAFNVRIYLTRRHALRFTRVPPLPRDSTRERIALPTIAADTDDDGAGGIVLFLVIGALVIAAIAFREPLLRLFSP